MKYIKSACRCLFISYYLENIMFNYLQILLHCSYTKVPSLRTKRKALKLGKTGCTIECSLRFIKIDLSHFELGNKHKIIIS